MKRIVLVALILLVVLGLPMFGQAKIAPKDQLYIEVSALGNLDYFYGRQGARRTHRVRRPRRV